MTTIDKSQIIQSDSTLTTTQNDWIDPATILWTH